MVRPLKQLIGYAFHLNRNVLGYPQSASLSVLLKCCWKGDSGQDPANRPNVVHQVDLSDARRILAHQRGHVINEAPENIVFCCCSCGWSVGWLHWHLMVLHCLELDDWPFMYPACARNRCGGASTCQLRLPYICCCCGTLAARGCLLTSFSSETEIASWHLSKMGSSSHNCCIVGWMCERPTSVPGWMVTPRKHLSGL